ncbi:MAG TPA: aldo/keto reductase [Thermodesulfobacteriota bacterium]
MSIAGRATPAATAAYATRLAGRLPAAAFTPLGVTGLTVSRLGFGTYRVDDRTPAHRAALERALESGVNLIDTSTNYTDGAAERLVGAVVGDLARSGRVPRDAVVVVSKIGFDLLDDQLSRSLERLDLETLDVCLLHNPESFLMDAARRGRSATPAALAATREAFHRRLREAFRYLETQVDAGRIGAYGVSSNTVARPTSDPEATSLADMLVAAREAGGERHRFRVLQAPMNLLEPAVALERREEGLTVLDLAMREGIAVLANRPLNAIGPGGLLRLADVEVPAPVVGLDAQRIVLAALEAEFQRDLAPEIEVGPGSVSPSDFFRWSDELAGVSGRVKTLEHWRHVETRMVIPAMNQVVRVLDGALAGEVGERWRSWRGRYVPELARYLEAMRREAALKSRAASEAVRTLVDRHLPPDRRAESLSRKAIWVVASTSGVTAVLAGMRAPEYVADAVGVLAWPPHPHPGAVYEALARVRG